MTPNNAMQIIKSFVKCSWENGNHEKGVNDQVWEAIDVLLKQIDHKNMLLRSALPYLEHEELVDRGALWSARGWGSVTAIERAERKHRQTEEFIKLITEEIA